MGTRKVKMVQAMATQTGPQRSVDAVIEVGEAEAERLVDRGFAVYADEPEPKEPKRKKVNGE